ncbi:MAG: response regulator transcription factor, partial [Pseudomonadota bacterium]
MRGRKEVLIVDDHPLFREGLKNTIVRTGRYEVVGEVGRALDALKLVAQIDIDLALIDIGLPDGNGIELAKTLKRSRSEVRILIISVHTAANYIADAFEAGAAGYLVKDSLPEKLIRALDVVA